MSSDPGGEQVSDNFILGMLDDPTDAFIADACMWDSHDFGIVDADKRRARMQTMRSAAKALFKALTREGMFQNEIK